MNMYFKASRCEFVALSCKLLKIEAGSCSTFNEDCETQNAPAFVWNMISKQIPVFEEHWQRGVATLKERSRGVCPQIKIASVQ